ncbi:hypothetical protein PRZ48_002913 [Zasmidium cellare]|uniref:Rhodopsin domain-containing protein n=1 Tax=Zasmidium cellare TaxID=395010 RepID=A0ABR0EU09_ZASCE|nr:hypothetical protein PRZ48_002913 [Zasmidium cellare]
MASLVSNPSENQGPSLLAFFIAFTTTSGVFVCLRFWIRISRRLVGWDDLVIGFAMIASIVQAVIASISIHYGYGRHAGDISKEGLKQALYYFYFCQICYKLVTWPTKISILLMYQRVFCDTPALKAYGLSFRLWMRILMTIVVATFVSTFIVGIFSCIPVQYSWDKSLKGHCVETIPWWYTYATLNMLTDIMILALPIPLINGLMKITKRQKYVLMGIFLLGAFVCIVTIVRMTTLDTGAKGKDSTYTGSATLKWTAVETNVGIICACLPLLRPILNKLIPWFAERSNHNRGPRTGYIISSVNTMSTGLRTIDSSKNSEPWSNSEKNETTLDQISERDPDSRNNSDVEAYGGIRKTTEVELREENERPDDLDSVKDEKHGYRRSSEHPV